MEFKVRTLKEMFFVFPDVEYSMETVGFVWEKWVIEVREHNGRRQFTIFLAFGKRGRKQSGPIIQHALRHIMLVHNLNFKIDPLAKVRKHKYIQPAHLAIFRLFRKFRVFVLDIDDAITSRF